MSTEGMRRRYKQEISHLKIELTRLRAVAKAAQELDDATKPIEPDVQGSGRMWSETSERAADELFVALAARREGAGGGEGVIIERVIATISILFLAGFCLYAVWNWMPPTSRRWEPTTTLRIEEWTTSTLPAPGIAGRLVKVSRYFKDDGVVWTKVEDPDVDPGVGRGEGEK